MHQNLLQESHTGTAMEASSRNEVEAEVEGFPRRRGLKGLRETSMASTAKLFQVKRRAQNCTVALFTPWFPFRHDFCVHDGVFNLVHRAHATLLEWYLRSDVELTPEFSRRRLG